MQSPHRLSLSLIGLALGLLPPAAAQDRLLDDPWGLMSQGRYLQALARAERDAGQPDPQPWAQDVLATMRAAVGDHAGAKQAMGETADGTPIPTSSPLEDAERLDALGAIVAAAHGRQVVIINEAHHVPETRHLTLGLLRPLYEQGFRYLACEAFTPQIADYGTAGHPTFTTCGGYVAEPVFADLVRVAAQLGYRLIHYETEQPGGAGDQADRINARETAQCRNLMERIYADDPQARVLIHCGYSHATEDWRTLGDGRELAWMAARLGREQGTDPLTIDQTRQRQGATSDAGPPVWRHAVANDLVPRPSVFRFEDGEFFVEGDGWAGKVDMQVFHPPVAMTRGRPDWLALDGRRELVEIPAELLLEGARVLVQAFGDEEGDDAIPVDQVAWPGTGDPPALWLPKGNYRLVAQDEQGEVIATARHEDG